MKVCDCSVGGAIKGTRGHCRAADAVPCTWAQHWGHQQRCLFCMLGRQGCHKGEACALLVYRHQVAERLAQQARQLPQGTPASQPAIAAACRLSRCLTLEL